MTRVSNQNVTNKPQTEPSIGARVVRWALVFFVGACAWSIGYFGSVVETKASGTDDGLPPRTIEEQQNIDVYKRTSDAVVFISTITLTYDPFDFFQEIQPKEGAGSGIIVDSKAGTILTNLHVIKDAHKIEIFLSNGQNSRARLVGYDESFDIAVLQLVDPPADLVAVGFGDSSRIEVGQRVLAIGNPFGLNRTLTSGIVSSLNRTVRSPVGKLMTGLIQTDAAINPGNSGGALLDMSGKLLGINTAILSNSGDSAGIGFAVPINSVKRVLPELIATGRVLRPEIGWVLVDTNNGPMVRRIIQDGPAAKAGVEPIERPVNNVFVKGYVRDFDRADLIVAVNGRAVDSREQVEQAVAEADVEQGLRFTMRRGGREGKEREVVIKPALK